MDGMNKLTALGGIAGGFRGVPAGEWGGEAGRRQRLVAVHDPGGERRHLFGVGEGSAEAVAGAKQERTCIQFSTSSWHIIRGRCSVSKIYESGRVGQKWVSRHALATCH